MSPGDPVTLAATGEKGRICRILQFGECCVQFEELGCRRVVEDDLRSSTEPAPQCTPNCRNGC
jgi:hypothetical protein